MSSDRSSPNLGSKRCVHDVHHGSLTQIRFRPISGVVPDEIHHITNRNVQRSIPFELHLPQFQPERFFTKLGTSRRVQAVRFDSFKGLIYRSRRHLIADSLRFEFPSQSILDDKKVSARSHVADPTRQISIPWSRTSIPLRPVIRENTHFQSE
jgi:hypothetical protein